MALEKQNVSISFAQGIDTKTDPNQVVAGKLLDLQNVVFTTTLRFGKRNGYELLASLSSSGVNLSDFKSELVAFDGANLKSYSPSNSTVVNKGPIISVDLSVTSVVRTSNSQTQPDSAFNAVGLYLYTWVDSLYGAQYTVVSSETGNQVIPITSLTTNARYPRAWSVGNYLIITYVDISTNHLRYISISTNNLAAGASSPVDIATTVNASQYFYDGVVHNNSLYLSWNASDGGGAVRTTYLDANLNLHNTVAQSGEQASACIGVFSDSSVTNTIWTVYSDGTNVKYFIVDIGVLSTILAPTTIVSGLSNVNNVTGFADNNQGTVFYQTQNTYSYSSVRSDYISTATMTSTGTVTSPVVFLRGVGLVSKPFKHDGNTYLVVAYSGSEQPTYFLVNAVGSIVAKLAYGNGGGYTTAAVLTNANQLSTSEFQFSYLFKDSLETQSGFLFSNTGVNSAIVSFEAADLYQTADLGNNLNISGGFLWAYDGYSPTEQNFHLFPEDYGYSAASSGAGGLAAGSYNYISLYEWTDNQGNIHRSGYGTPLPVVLSVPTTGVTLNIPTLRLTAKQNVSVTLYRNAPTVATNVFYLVSSITNPKLSTSAVDSVVITDTSSDANIVGNELLYTNGGVVPDSGAPAAAAMTIYKNRLMLVNAEDRNQIWFSKQTLQATPVEMSEFFTLFIDPRFGHMTALAVMDDKLIIFKENAIFYIAGEGPDSTGANNDFSEAVFITSVVGCVNFKSIVLTQDGLMFQSNKGIWLLGRNLSVSYIGAEVEEFNSFMVTSALIIPQTTQVRFTLSNGIALIYDYYDSHRQWGTFTNHNASGAVIFEDLFTYLTPTGLILQESPGTYTDNGVPFYMSLSTGWFSFSGLQGLERIYRLYLLGQFITPHIINVSVAYDFNPYNVQTAQIRPTELNNTAWGSDPFWGSTQAWGGAALTEQYRVNLTKQKCQALQVTIQEAIDTSNTVYGAGFVLEAMGILTGRKSSYPRLPATKIVT